VNLHPPDLVEVGHFGGRVVVCQFRIHGPPGTLFEGRIIPMQMTFRDGYPYRPPEVLFRCRIFHMNILNQLDGNSHLLHLNQVWGSDWSIVKLLDHVIHLLRFPDITLLPKPYNELYDILETEYFKMMKERQVHANLQEGSQISSRTGQMHEIGIEEESKFTEGSKTWTNNNMSTALNMSQTTFTTRSSMPIELVKSKFSRLNRVQTMHLSVLYLYIFDNGAYSTLARTTGKSQEEIDAEEADELEEGEGDDEKESAH
jgi:ubiquitin-protein ligase